MQKERLILKEYTYTIEDELGIHARPAGLLSKLAKSFPDTLVTVTKGDKTVKASQLMKLMNLGVKSLFNISQHASWRVFCRHAALNFLEIPPVFRRKFALSGGKIPRHPACFKILNRL